MASEIDYYGEVLVGCIECNRMLIRGMASATQAQRLARHADVFKASVVVDARVISVPPIGTSGDQSLTPQPSAATVSISIAIVARPHPSPTATKRLLKRL